MVGLRCERICPLVNGNVDHKGVYSHKIKTIKYKGRDIQISMMVTKEHPITSVQISSDKTVQCKLPEYILDPKRIKYGGTGAFFINCSHCSLNGIWTSIHVPSE